MSKVIRLTEQDLIRLVNRVIKEQKSSRPLINEAAAEMVINKVKKQMDSGKNPDPKVVSQIKKCITTKQLTSLMFLTTSAGAYALGIIAMLIANPVGLAVGGVLALSSIIVIFITGLPEDQCGLGSDPAKDVKALLSCMGI